MAKIKIYIVLILNLPSSVALGGPRWVPGTNLNNTAATDIPSNLTSTLQMAIVNVQKLRLPHCEPQGGHRCSLKPSLVKPPCARSPHAGTSEAWRFDRGRFEKPTVASVRLTAWQAQFLTSSHAHLKRGALTGEGLRNQLWPLCGSQFASGHCVVHSLAGAVFDHQLWPSEKWRFDGGRFEGTSVAAVLFKFVLGTHLGPPNATLPGKLRMRTTQILDFCHCVV